ncbi:protein ULTRAPETALA 2 [Ziziphus jujuba]|uniref:Protein ULTRAPETALA 2 n=1 Tax=Ziziphus jujuba TaxID=326968 RepID=A0ABM3IFJ2_ZIZJJ|nr:protein ULTRAPETALA 2 [Ziziphus jujuba]
MARGPKRPAKRVVVSESGMFTDEKMNNIKGLQRGPDFVATPCGCTSRRFGDSTGILKVFTSGLFLITCNCSPQCQQGRMTPEEFEKHSMREGLRKWKSNIWVIKDDEKIPLWKTGILKYYKHASNVNNRACRTRRKRNFHRDEFITCSKCKKDRRFRLRTKEECRIYHDALANKRWKCVDGPYDRITCEDAEERATRKIVRGCPRTATCKGCTSCVCFGCIRCRFWDCRCRTCVDFMQNAEP